MRSPFRLFFIYLLIIMAGLIPFGVSPVLSATPGSAGIVGRHIPMGSTVEPYSSHLSGCSGYPYRYLVDH